MDKYELVLDIVEHPERYTAVQIEEMMSDPEAREIYSLLCKTESAVMSDAETDVDAEWESFARRHDNYAEPEGYENNTGRIERACSRLSSLFRSNRAASIAAIVCTSVIAVAAGIAVSVAVSNRPVQTDEIESASSAVISAQAQSISVDSVDNELMAVGTGADMTPVMFEDEPLETIATAVASAYGLEVRFNDEETSSLHLYYKFDPSLSLDEVVSQLNTFERINIRLEGNTLIID